MLGASRCAQPGSGRLLPACAPLHPARGAGLARTHLHCEIWFQFPPALPATYASLCFWVCSASRQPKGELGTLWRGLTPCTARPRRVPAPALATAHPGPGPGPGPLRGAPWPGEGEQPPALFPQRGTRGSDPRGAPCRAGGRYVGRLSPSSPTRAVFLGSPRVCESRVPAWVQRERRGRFSLRVHTRVQIGVAVSSGGARPPASHSGRSRRSPPVGVLPQDPPGGRGTPPVGSLPSAAWKDAPQGPLPDPQVQPPRLARAPAATPAHTAPGVGDDPVFNFN